MQGMAQWADGNHRSGFMNELYFYVAAILGDNQYLTIVDRQVTDEVTEAGQGEQTYSVEQTVTFANGVVIHQSVERIVEAEPNEVTCAECWISYRVLSEPEALQVTPKSKHFINTCQQTFWLNIQRTQREVSESHLRPTITVETKKYHDRPGKS